MAWRMTNALRRLYRRRNRLVRKLWAAQGALAPEHQDALGRVDDEIDALEDYLYALPRARQSLLWVLRWRRVELLVAHAHELLARYK